MARLARDGACPAVVGDQVMSHPTFAGDLAAVLVASPAARAGTIHVTNDGRPVSWYGLAAGVRALRPRPR
ncbi:sugar nucleotide-binding protein [Pseudonocardia sp. MCCB 268]|nr:sugar nucleotide-binding protein [Pseudonocardia cytotoxica]